MFGNGAQIPLRTSSIVLDCAVGDGGLPNCVSWWWLISILVVGFTPFPMVSDRFDTWLQSLTALTWCRVWWWLNPVTLVVDYPARCGVVVGVGRWVVTTALAATTGDVHKILH